MAQRTMTLQAIRIKASRKDAFYFLDNVSGVEVLDYFEKWAKSLSPDHFNNHTKQTYGTKPLVERRNRLVVLTMRTGHYGSPGEHVIDTAKHAPQYETKDIDAATVETRCALLVPPGADRGLFFIERVVIEGCGSRVWSSFSEHLKDLLHTKNADDGRPLRATIQAHTVNELDEWLEGADLESIKATIKSAHKDVADDGDTRGYSFEYTGMLKPTNGTKYFPRWVRDLILKHGIGEAAEIGFPVVEGSDYEDIAVTVGDGDRHKTFVVGREKTPALKLLLSGHGEQKLTTDRLIEEIDEAAKDYYARHNIAYQMGWTRAPRS
ncbi:hypothetical protein QFZ52_001787 [Arthrobacter woluwensis]|nr:hypothetical protein [Arthrobacter woluwensis]